jgi:Cft2 family RNA processing exonuclease
MSQEATPDAWFRGRHGERCSHIDYIVISHFQTDHIGYIVYGGLWKLRNVYKYDIGRTLLRDYRCMFTQSSSWSKSDVDPQSKGFGL